MDNCKPGRKKAFYTFYDRKTDVLLFAGTAADLAARKFFASASSVQSVACRCLSGQNKRYTVVVEDCAV